MGKEDEIKCGHWGWDKQNNELIFIIHEDKDGGEGSPSALESGMQSIFQEQLGTSSAIRFRKRFQRKVRTGKPDVVILQDIKDVVLFTCDVKMLNIEFINFFHTNAVDRLLRSLIIYFQFFFQTWNQMQFRRAEAKRCLRHPRVTYLENIVRDDLADLRSMVARNFAIILMGSEDASNFHHMNKKNNVSLSDKDRKRFELFIVIMCQVIWISMNRKFMSLIEKEMDRMLRTYTFSLVQHSPFRSTAFDANPEEERVLVGRAYRSERKLYKKSPLIQEIVNDEHDFNMLSIGVSHLGWSDERMEYLEAAYTAPEEILEEIEIGNGILGIPRKFLDILLKPKEIDTTKKQESFMKPVPEFKLPRPYIDDTEISEFSHKWPCTYQEAPEIAANRIKQRKLWRDYVAKGGNIPLQEDVGVSTHTATEVTIML